jgi:hypothetical protein
MSNRGPKLPKPKKPPRTAEKRRISLVGVILAAATLIGVPAAVFALYPRVTVTVSDPVDPNNPFSSSVTITNTGYIQLKSVNAGICFDKIEILRPSGSKPPTTTVLGDCRKQSIRIEEWVPHDLGLDDRFTVAISDLFGNPAEHQSSLVEAQISILVPYQLPLLHIHCQKRFPLFAKRQSNGNFYWYADAPRSK